MALKTHIESRMANHAIAGWLRETREVKDDLARSNLKGEARECLMRTLDQMDKSMRITEVLQLKLLKPDSWV